MFHASQALDALGGDRELLRIVAQAYIDEAPKLVERLGVALQQHNAKDLQFAAHALKGSVRFFGDTPIYNLAYSLETQGRTGNLDRAREALDQLTKDVPQLVLELAAWCRAFP